VCLPGPRPRGPGPKMRPPGWILAGPDLKRFLIICLARMKILLRNEITSTAQGCCATTPTQTYPVSAYSGAGYCGGCVADPGRSPDGRGENH
jgi:hypothetical protein